jgi:hypothetical protein
MARPGGAQIRPERPYVAQLMVLPHVAEERERIPDSRCRRALLDRGTCLGRVVSAVGLRAFLHVVRPAHMLGVEQPADVGPSQVDRRLAGGQLLPDGPAELGDPVRPDDVVDAAHGRTGPAPGRPGGHQVEVVGQGP